jgi:microcompartment protein CcmL/EutN
MEPALALIEYKSVARGIASCDAMVKKAPVRILQTHPVCPGKYITIVCGEVADVEEARLAGLASGGDMVVADLFLPYVHRDVIPALSGAVRIDAFGALAVIETFAVATCLRAADVAAKRAAVQLVEIRLANGLGGKGYFVMTGELTDVEEALAAAAAFARSEGQLAGEALIPAPHPDLLDKGLYWGQS